MSEKTLIERKCRSCGTWNKDEDYCTNCNEVISPREINRIKEEKKRIEEKNRPKGKYETMMLNLRNHDNFLYRILYKFFLSIELLVTAISGFVVWFVAAANG